MKQGGKENGPTFLMIGAARTGTTTLYSYLQEHPDIYLPKEKRPEPHFFLKQAEYSRGIDYYLEKVFGGAEGQTARGECSTSYICHEHVAKRIHAHFPEIKLIVLLRNPVERAWSNYWHTVKAGLETLSFEEALAQEEKRLREITDPVWQEIRPFAYCERGFYFKQLSAYYHYFSREQLKILLFEELVQMPRLVVQDTLRFLGLDADIKTIAWDRITNSSAPVDRGIPDGALVFLRRLYKDDIQQCGELIGRQLSHWTKPTESSSALELKKQSA